MKLHKVVCEIPIPPGYTGPPIRTFWLSAHGDASKLVTKLVKESGLKRNTFSCYEVDVPTNKASLLEWLNANCTR